MAWIKERSTDDADKRFVACYRDREGQQRSARTCSSKRAAERAADRADFGRRPIGKILPSEIQRWVTTASAGGLSAASVRNYHTMLHLGKPGPT